MRLLTETTPLASRLPLNHTRVTKILAMTIHNWLTMQKMLKCFLTLFTRHMFNFDPYSLIHNRPNSKSFEVALTWDQTVTLAIFWTWNRKNMKLTRTLFISQLIRLQHINQQSVPRLPLTIATIKLTMKRWKRQINLTFVKLQFTRLNKNTKQKSPMQLIPKTTKRPRLVFMLMLWNCFLGPYIGSMPWEIFQFSWYWHYICYSRTIQ